VALFKKKITWHKLFETVEAAETRVPLNKVTTVFVNNKKICVAHTASGFYAVADKCPHNGASLGTGWCTEDDTVICPVHRYRFDLKTGRAKSGVGDYVNTYPVEVQEGSMYIGFESIVWDLF